MNKEKLREIFDLAKESNMDLAIELTVPTRTATEIIVVKHDNLDYKLEYYLNNYNDNLELSRCTDIKILSSELVKWGD